MKEPQKVPGVAINEPKILQFSYFPKGIRNVTPLEIMDFKTAYLFIRSNTLKVKCQHLRTLESKAASKFKNNHFPYVTFSGVFSQRANDKIISHSSAICIDLDNIEDLDIMRCQLLLDDNIETDLLFISPSGTGLKWVVSDPLINANTHEAYFKMIRDYLRDKYGIIADNTPDISRACFLSWDPEVIINPKLL